MENQRAARKESRELSIGGRGLCPWWCGWSGRGGRCVQCQLGAGSRLYIVELVLHVLELLLLLVLVQHGGKEYRSIMGGRDPCSRSPMSRPLGRVTELSEMPTQPTYRLHQLDAVQSKWKLGTDKPWSMKYPRS